MNKYIKNLMESMFDDDIFKDDENILSELNVSKHISNEYPEDFCKLITLLITKLNDNLDEYRNNCPDFRGRFLLRFAFYFIKPNDLSSLITPALKIVLEFKDEIKGRRIDLFLKYYSQKTGLSSGCYIGKNSSGYSNFEDIVYNKDNKQIDINLADYIYSFKPYDYSSINVEVEVDTADSIPSTNKNILNYIDDIKDKITKKNFIIFMNTDDETCDCYVTSDGYKLINQIKQF